MSDFKYVGSELDLFALARNWKAYWISQIRPFLKGDILEVGAGIGTNTLLLDPGGADRWVCLEPDPDMTSVMVNQLAGVTTRKYETVCGTLQAIQGQQFDTIIYIDVLEHIEHDAAELVLAASLLRPGGRVIVLSPAHQRLYSPFDASIGHFRRYDKPMIRAISPPGLILERLRYLDVFGLSVSTANTFFLKQSMPTREQIKFWDTWIIPPSRVLDKLIGYAAGKTIIAVWQKPA